MKITLNGTRGFVASHLDDSEDKIVEKLNGIDAVFNLAEAPIIKK